MKIFPRARNFSPGGNSPARRLFPVGKLPSRLGSQSADFYGTAETITHGIGTNHQKTGLDHGTNHQKTGLDHYHGTSYVK
jgi:hypothetical protein